MRLQYLPIDEINPFDRSHRPADNAHGFDAVDKVPGEHLEGALAVKGRVEAGDVIWPIAVCKRSLVPHDRRVGSEAKYQRLDGFKRYMGQRMAGVTEILCEVYDSYSPGCQKGQPMLIEGESLGKVIYQLYSGTYDPVAWPYQGRISIEDCETVHVHLGNVRMEFTREQFLSLAGGFAEAADTLRKRRGL